MTNPSPDILGNTDAPGMADAVDSRSRRIEATARAFLTPRQPNRDGTLSYLAGGQTFWVDTPDGRVAVARAGSGPKVLLVHGWEGQASDLSTLAGVILDAGFQVIALELPAHGASDGQAASIPMAARALASVQASVGPFHAAVGHSVGSATLVHAMAAGLKVGKAVLIAAPARYVDYARGFAAAAGLDSAETSDMIDLLRQQGVDVRSVSTTDSAARLTQPALFIHSSDDRVVPLGNAISASQAWAGATLLRLDGLGHGRILHAVAVSEAVGRFITDNAAT